MATASRALLSRAALSPLHAVAAARRIPLLLRPLAAAATLLPAASDAGRGAMRCYSTQPATSSMRDSSPNWNNRPPKETILLDGCDFEHWLVVMDPPPGDPANPDPTRDEIIDSYIKTLAQVVGSEEEARHKIYSVSTRHYFAFGALVSEELSYKIKELPRVRWVLPDSYLDVKNKDYGGEPFINGEAVPYDPKYHEEWVRNNARANERSRRNDRPRNFDRSRNFERRENQQNFQNRDVPPGPNGPPPPGGPGFSGPPPPGGPGFSGPPPPGGPGFSGPPPPGGPGFSGPPPPGGPGFNGPPPPGGPGFNGPPPPGRPGFNGPPAPGQGMPPPNYQPQMPNPQVGYNQQGGAPYQGGNQGYQGNPGQAYPGANAGYQGGATGYQGSSYQGGNPNAPNYQGGGNTGYGGNGQGYPGQNGY